MPFKHAALIAGLIAVMARPATAEQTTLGSHVISAVSVDPPAVHLDDPLDRLRLLVTGKCGDRWIDLTDAATAKIDDPGVAAVGPYMEVTPRGDGASAIHVYFGRFQVEVPVHVDHFHAGRTIQFANQIVPIFTKWNCNSGGCHGKSGGQNGFHLSLLGFEPSEDYEYLVKEGRGRRLSPADPDQSLLLRKASGQLPHGGGRLIRAGDDDYQLLQAWIRQGMPQQSSDPASVERIEIAPAERVLAPHSSQRLRITAVLRDGRREDVTRHAIFQSNNDDVAIVDKDARVTIQGQSGEAAVMARYQGFVAVFRALIPLENVSANVSSFERKNFIDDHAVRKWRDLGLTPSALTNDYQFIRRLYLDLAGRLPTPAEVTRFVAAKSPDKRDRLIDRLLDGPEYASLMAMKWGAILQNHRGERSDQAPETYAFANWLREAFATDMPYDQFVRAIVTATGTAELNPPAAWYRNLKGREETVDAFAQVFLGTRIQCARCHHHPNEKWGQDDYVALSSFFARLQRRREGRTTSSREYSAVVVARKGSAVNARTGRSTPPRGLDGPIVVVRPGEDPRARLVDWLIEPKNPFFARALVNRLWGHFFSRGLVEPLDDIRVTNPPSNPELLDALAGEFARSGYHIKRIVRLIVASNTYQLSSAPTPGNIQDKQNFARYYPRRLPAEVLVDSVDQATAAHTGFGLPVGMRAIDLPDETTGSYFLEVFGRPQRSTACECERATEANLGQSLHLMNSRELQDKLDDRQGRAAQMAVDKRGEPEKITELYLWFFSRRPSADELKSAGEYLRTHKDKRQAFQNLIWALVNSKEFLFNT